MSKLGKKPIIIPKDTKVKLESGRIFLTGPKGSRELTLNDKIFAATIVDDKDRKSTRLNSSHKPISYAVFCLKKKN